MPKKRKSKNEKWAYNEQQKEFQVFNNYLQIISTEIDGDSMTVTGSSTLHIT